MKIVRTLINASIAVVPLILSTGCARMPLAPQQNQAKSIPATGKPSLPADSGSPSVKASPKKVAGSTIPNAKDAGL